MKKVLLLAVALTFGASMAFAKKMDEKEKLVNNMVKACKADLAKDPATTETADGEVIWKNLEDKEHAGKLAKNCHKAHEKYEAKYHKESEEQEKEEHHE